MAVTFAKSTEKFSHPFESNGVYNLSIQDVEQKIKNTVLARRVRTDEYLKDFDRLRTGYITKTQFDRCLDQYYGIVLDHIEDKTLMMKYGCEDGMVNYRDFCKTIDSGLNSQSGAIPVTIYKKRPLSGSSLERSWKIIERIAPYYKYHGISIKSSYTEFDQHNIGLVTESQFYRRFPGPPNVTQTEQMLLARRYAHPTKSEMCNYLDFHQDVVNLLSSQANEINSGGTATTNSGNILKKGESLSSIDLVFNKIREAVHKNGIRTTEFFKDHDKLRSGVITKNQFICGLSLCCGNQANLSRDEIDLLVEFYKTKDGRVRYKEFCHLMENAFNVPYLEKNPTIDFYRPPTGSLARVPNNLNVKDENECQQILNSLREIVRRKRLLLYPHFKDFDRGFCNTRGVTKTQFSRMLHMVGLIISPVELEILCRKFEYPIGGDINYPAFVQAIDAEYVGHAPVTGEWNSTILKNQQQEDEQYPDITSVDVDDLIRRIQHHVLVNRIRIEEFFQDFDPLRHGSIGTSRFRMGLSAMGQQHLSEAQILAILNRYSDPSRKGNILWTNFFNDIDQVFTQKGLEKQPTAVPSETYHVPKRGTTDWSQVSDDEQRKLEHAMEKMRQKTNHRRILTKPCFQDFDKHNVGYVTRSQLRQCMTYLSLDCNVDEVDLLYKKFSDETGFNYHKFLNELQPSEIQEQKYLNRLEELRITNKRKFQRSNITVPKDISEVMTKIKTKVVKEAIRVFEFMKDYDKLKTGRMLKTSFPRALDLCTLGLTTDEINTVIEWYSSPAHKDYVDYCRFCDDVEMSFTLKGLEKNPTCVPVQFKPDPNWNNINFLPEGKEMLEAVLHRLADRVRIRRIQLFPLFEDYDRVHNGTVSRSQLRRVLSELELGSLVSSREFHLMYDKFDCVIGGKHDFNYVQFCETLNNYALFDPNVP